MRSATKPDPYGPVLCPFDPLNEALEETVWVDLLQPIDDPKEAAEPKA